MNTTPTPLTVRFTGRDSDYARVWYTGLVLSFLTAGLYLPFARTACRRWLVSHLEVGGVPLAFDGRVRTLLPSFLMRYALVWAGVVFAYRAVDVPGVDTLVSMRPLQLLFAGGVLLPGLPLICWVPPRFWLEGLRLGDRHFTVPRRGSRVRTLGMVLGGLTLAALLVLFALVEVDLRAAQATALLAVSAVFAFAILILWSLQTAGMTRVPFIGVPEVHFDGVPVQWSEAPELDGLLRAEVGLDADSRLIYGLFLGCVALFISAPWLSGQDAAATSATFTRAFTALVFFVEAPRNAPAQTWMAYRSAWTQLRYPGWRVHVDLPAERCARALRSDAHVALLTAGLSTPYRTVKRLHLLAESLTFEPVEAVEPVSSRA